MQVLENLLSHVPFIRKPLENEIYQNEAEMQEKGRHEIQQSRKSTKKGGKDGEKKSKHDSYTATNPLP